MVSENTQQVTLKYFLYFLICLSSSYVIIRRTIYCLNVLFLFCLRLRHYTVRYRERHRKWNYQTCPTSDTVIDNLKPNAVYEFGVQPNAKDVTGVWSKPVIHSISSGGTEGMFNVSFFTIFSIPHQIKQ